MFSSYNVKVRKKRKGALMTDFPSSQKLSGVEPVLDYILSPTLCSQILVKHKYVVIGES